MSSLYDLMNIGTDRSSHSELFQSSGIQIHVLIQNYDIPIDYSESQSIINPSFFYLARMREYYQTHFHGEGYEIYY